MKVHGACHCGGVAYEAEVDPARVTICHCTDCQHLTGSAYRVTVPTRIEDFRLLRGVLTAYVKTGDSGARRVQSFCPTCGSPIHTAAFERPVMYGLRTGCIAERDALPPRRQVWCRSALAWTKNLDGLPGSDREQGVR